jgi:hypothetical protein
MIGTEASKRSRISPMPELLNGSFDELLTNRGFGQYRDQHVVVDINATDEQLILDFREWLKQKRKSAAVHTPSHNLSEKDMNEWIKYRVLALIDLDIFCAYTNDSLRWDNHLLV